MVRPRLASESYFATSLQMWGKHKNATRNFFFSKSSLLYCCQGEDPDELLITDDDEELEI